MKGKIYRARLAKEGEKRSKDIVGEGARPARQVTRAHISLSLSEKEGRQGKTAKELERRETAGGAGVKPAWRIERASDR